MAFLTQRLQVLVGTILRIVVKVSYGEHNLGTGYWMRFVIFGSTKLAFSS